MAIDPIIDEIKQKLDIITVISNYITLKKAGTNYKANCPFHGERTPSFMVSPERQTFRCFGCSEAGDIFTFVQKIENIDFPYALELLSRQAGVVLPERNKQSVKPKSGVSKDDIYAANGYIAQACHLILAHPTGKAALAYLKNRSLSDETIEAFQIGYAPPQSQALAGLIAKKNVSAKALEAAGHPERFRDRILFPFLDIIGNVVGFSGRAMGDQQPKYLNTPETDVFKKNRYIYGLYQAKQAIRDQGKVVLVEGQMDLVLAHQAGTKYAVATSGTALTEEHLRILRRYSDVLLVAFDGDKAGQKAIERAVHLALLFDFDVKIIQLPAGRDPGDIITENPSEWHALIAQPTNVIDWLFSFHFPGEKAHYATAERQTIFDAIFPYVAQLEDGISRAYLLQRLATLLHLNSDQPVRDSFEKWVKSKGSKKPNNQNTQDTTSKAVSKDAVTTPPSSTVDPERRLIGLLFLHPELLKEAQLVLQEHHYGNDALRNLYKTAVSWYNNNQQLNSSSPALIEAVVPTLDPRWRQSLEKLLFETEARIAEYNPEERMQEMTALVRQLHTREREARIQHFSKKIAEAESSNNRQLVKQLIEELQHSMK